MSEGGFRIGWLADLEALGRDPRRLAELQAVVGVDMVWLESGRYHTGGFRLSEEVWLRSPFRNWREQPGLARHRAIRHLPETSYPVLPGVLGGADDADLHAVLDAAHGLGLAVWGHMGLWSYGSTVYPEMAASDLRGLPLPPAEDVWGDCFCPSKPFLNAWLTDCLRDAAARYPIDGIEIDHARYVPPVSLPNLWACACPDCARQAAAWGIDQRQLVEALLSGWERVQKMPAVAIQAALDSTESPIVAADTLLGESLASRWFSLRARHLTTALNRMAEATHKAAQRPFAFGVDVFPPSVALLGGHVYHDLTKLDFFTGGFGLIGWGNTGPDACREWTRFLCRRWPSLEEQRVLCSLYRLLGYSSLRLPGTCAELEQPSGALLATVQAQEMARLAEIRPRGKPIYPPVNLVSLGIGGAQVVSKAARTHGLDGVMFAGLERLSPEEQQTLKDTLP